MVLKTLGAQILSLATRSPDSVIQTFGVHGELAVPEVAVKLRFNSAEPQIMLT